MSVAQRFSATRSTGRTIGSGIVIAALASALAGCSANIARLDSPSFALGEGASTAGPRRAAGGSSGDVPPLSRASEPAPAYAPAPSRQRSGTDLASLPPIEPAPATRREPTARALAVTPGNDGASAAAAVPQQASARGQQIEVQPGDTLYGLSRRHNVMISDLMAANDLKNPNLKPGQKLIVPAASSGRPVSRSERAARAPAERSGAGALPEATPTRPVAEGGGSYTVKPGDSLYSIAVRHKVKTADLQAANGITNARNVKPGTVLTIPGASAPASTASASVDLPPPAEPTAKAGTPAGGPSVKVLNAEGGRQAAATALPVEPRIATDATTSAVTSKLRWPVKGRIVQGFGARADGTHNDGVDIAVPAGSDVLAAESGVVAYAGSEVKTYGHLVLLRHDNGLVTAYAYNDRLLVQRGDRVKRGQPIAKAGKTGLADQPQLHFEVRVGSKPVDPIGYLERM